MERDMNQPALPTLCRGGCGFYGSPATDNLCSKCFKDTLKRKQDPGRLSPNTSSSSSPKSADSTSSHESNSPTTSSNCTPIMMNVIDGVVDVPSMIQNALNEKIAAAAAAASTNDEAAKKSVQDNPPPSCTPPSSEDVENSAPPSEKKSNRCKECRKKVGFTGFECRCGGLFCAIHRYSDMHQCTFDYKALGAEEIRKNNPVVKNEKIQKL